MSKKIDLVSALKAQGVEFEDGQEKVIAELSTAVEKAMTEQGTTFETSLAKAIDERIGVKSDKRSVRRKISDYCALEN